MKAGWKKITYGELGRIFNGNSISESDKKKYFVGLEEGMPYVGTKDVGFDHTIQYESGVLVPSNKLSDFKMAPPDTVLVCAEGGSAGRKIALTDRTICFGNKLYAICPAPPTNSSFVFYYCLSENFIKQFKDSMAGIIGGVSLNKFKEICITLPPLPEQQRIVSILDEAFASIATAKANAEKNRQNARALFESHLNSIDAEKVPLGDLVKITTGKLDANAAVEDGRYPFFTCSREIFAIDNFAFDCEAILLAGNNAVGDFNVKHYKGKFNAYQRTYVITVNEKKLVLYRFLYFQMLKSLKRFKEQSVGAGTKFLKLGMIKDMEIALPSIAVQEQIVSTMDSLREQTGNLESIYQQKLAALDALKKSLLEQAFTGQL